MHVPVSGLPLLDLATDEYQAPCLPQIAPTTYTAAMQHTTNSTPAMDDVPNTPHRKLLANSVVRPGQVLAVITEDCTIVQFIGGFKAPTACPTGSSEPLEYAWVEYAPSGQAAVQGWLQIYTQDADGNKVFYLDDPNSAYQCVQKSKCNVGNTNNKHVYTRAHLIQLPPGCCRSVLSSRLCKHGPMLWCGLL